jgi:hypothetical protein
VILLYKLIVQHGTKNYDTYRVYFIIRPNELILLIIPALPLMVEICKRSINFIYKRIQSDCFVMRFVTCHGVYFGRACSPLNYVLFCHKRYQVSLCDFGRPINC